MHLLNASPVENTSWRERESECSAFSISESLSEINRPALIPPLLVLHPTPPPFPSLIESQVYARGQTVRHHLVMTSKILNAERTKSEREREREDILDICINLPEAGVLDCGPRLPPSFAWAASTLVRAFPPPPIPWYVFKRRAKAQEKFSGN
ncbi:hypothetical protein CDAR_109331 [Caerostris darwini]|uniref:Uncharacterized protein n=1 Tax=Caerostris darwini TaxID=1538125 RepID=A0AAV4TTT8_9ARAC|nr:hypothetical protein CDAR_109331 [Caerostris darwini]